MKKLIVILSIIIVVIFCNCNNSADDPQDSTPAQRGDTSVNKIDSTAVFDSTTTQP